MKYSVETIPSNYEKIHSINIFMLNIIHHCYIIKKKLQVSSAVFLQVHLMLRSQVLFKPTNILSFLVNMVNVTTKQIVRLLHEMLWSRKTFIRFLTEINEKVQKQQFATKASVRSFCSRLKFKYK